MNWPISRHKKLVAVLGKDGSIRTELISEEKLDEFELEHLVKLWKDSSVPLNPDKRTKTFKDWKENRNYLKNRIKELSTRVNKK